MDYLLNNISFSSINLILNAIYLHVRTVYTVVPQYPRGFKYHSWPSQWGFHIGGFASTDSTIHRNFDLCLRCKTCK